MNFKELQSGASIYCLDRQNVTCSSCLVLSVSQSRFENKLGQQPQMVLDLTIDDNGTRKTYVVPDSLSRAYANNIVLSTEKECILNEIKAIKQTSDNIINSVDKHRKTSQKCENLIMELDADLKDKIKTDERINSLEKAICKLTDLFNNKFNSENTKSNKSDK